MMFWIPYFSLLLALQVKGAVHVDTRFLFSLSVFAFFPLPREPHFRAVEKVRSKVASLLGLVFLWQASYLPSPSTLWDFLVRPELRPGWSLVYDFSVSLLSVQWLVGVLGMGLLAYVFGYTRWRRLSPFLIACCLTLIALGTRGTTIRSDAAEQFFATEAKRAAPILQSPENNFDIILLQICSWSWADMTSTHFDITPFLRQFDFVFTNFNTATSYSDPAALRLLQATCGQANHETIYSERPRQCYLLENLRDLGYSTTTALNHTGEYSGFRDYIARYGKTDPLMSLDGLVPSGTSFDDTPIYADHDVLSRWLSGRGEQEGKRALFYNTITLHTGVRYPDRPLVGNEQQYTIALQHFTGDVATFFEELKQSRRQAIVILVGEHGAALDGSPVELSLVRDIPLPAITHVPAAIKVFSPLFNDQDERGPQTFDGPSSYLALAQLLSTLLQRHPTSYQDLRDPALIQKLPETTSLSETKTSMVLQLPTGVIYRSQNDRTWTKLPTLYQTRPAGINKGISNEYSDIR